MSDHYSDSPMKPRNKQERQVAALSASLPDVTPKQRQWAIDTCFEKVGYAAKGEVWCSQCGMVHEKISSELGITLVGDETICPHCGTKLKLKNSNKCKILERCYFTVLTTCQRVQVCRHFIIENGRGRQTATSTLTMHLNTASMRLYRTGSLKTGQNASWHALVCKTLTTTTNGTLNEL